MCCLVGVIALLACGSATLPMYGRAAVHAMRPVAAQQLDTAVHMLAAVELFWQAASCVLVCAKELSVAGRCVLCCCILMMWLC